MKRVISTCLMLCLSAALALPASALDYSIDAPGNPDYGDPTSIEVVHTADGGAMKNEDVSKNAALIPPSFGSPSADALGTGTYLTPNLAPGGMAVGTISGGNMPIVFPPTSGDMVSFGVVPSNFRQVEAPRVYCNVVSWLTGGTQFVNQADVGGVYDGQWIMATSRWVTKVYKPSEPLPRTGY